MVVFLILISIVGLFFFPTGHFSMASNVSQPLSTLPNIVKSPVDVINSVH